jgi:hypothetical protein
VASDLYDPVVDLGRFAAANAAIDVMDENEARIEDWRRRNSK